MTDDERRELLEGVSDAIDETIALAQLAQEMLRLAQRNAGSPVQRLARLQAAMLLIGYTSQRLLEKVSDARGCDDECD